jgi:hypothetical protein
MLAAFAAASVVGCASVDQQQQSAEPRAEKTYNTGSRIPVGGSATVRSVEGSKEMQEDISARSRVGPGPTGK